MVDEMIEPNDQIKKHIKEVEREMLEEDKPNIWNVHIQGNMEKILEVDFQTFGVAVCENSGQLLSNLSTMAFYASVNYLKAKFKK